MTQNRPIAAPRYVVQQTPSGPKVVEVSGLQTANASAQPSTQSQLRGLIALTRLDRPIGIYLLLWPTMCALLLANQGTPSGSLILIFALGVVLTRSAGCIINDFADQWLDGSVQRTQSRPLATGAISSRTAIACFAVLMLVAFALVCFTNQTTILLAVLAALIACAYPYFKRFSNYPQAVLGLAFSMGIPMAYTASGKTPDAVCWLLFCANWLWTLAYDTFYAMVDRDDDIKMGARSTAILFGDLDLSAIATTQVIMLLALLALGQRAELSTTYFYGLGFILAQCALQLWIARSRQPQACLQAFLTNQWLGLSLFFSVLAGLVVI